MTTRSRAALRLQRFGIGSTARSALLWGLVILLLAVELRFLGARVEEARLGARPEAWVAPLRWLEVSHTLIVAWLAAAAAVGGRRLWWTARELLEVDGDRREVGLALFAHGACLAGVTGLLTPALAGARLPDGVRSALVLVLLPVWFLTGLSVATPLSRVLGFVSTAWRPLLRGLAAAGVSFALARAFASQDALWLPLSRATGEVAALLLGAFGSPVVLDRSELVVGTPTFSVVVTRFVAGYESVGVFAIFSLLLGLCASARLVFRRYLLLVLVGVGVVWLAGAVRVAALVAVGSQLSEGLALAAFRTQVGWLPMILAALGLVAIGVHHPSVARREAELDAGPSAKPSLAHLLPLLLLLGFGALGCALPGDPRGVAVLGVPFAGVAVFLLRRHRAPLLAPAPPLLALAIPVGVAIWVALASAQGLLVEPIPRPVAPAGFQASSYLPLHLLGFVLVVPMALELALRGFLQRRLQDSDFELCPQGRLTPLALLVPALTYGLLVGNLPGGFFLGLLLAGATALRGRLSDAVLVHVGFHVALVLAAFATGHHELWLGRAS